VDAVKREMKEETGLDIQDPKLVGIKQFPFQNEKKTDCRYIVLLFKAEKFTGTVVSSAEGYMEWIHYDQLSEIDTVNDLDDLLDVINNPNLTEFQYLVDGDIWTVSKK
jgi:8-oxo-dGTP diphosphatase